MVRTLQSILVPIDGSPPSLAALDHAITLARDYDATVTVLHVTPVGDPLSAENRREADRAMADAIDRAGGELGHIGRLSATGDPVREIVEAARGMDMIVMGTHGRSGRIHALLGSVAEGVVRNAPCPVLTVRDAGAAGYESFAERRHGRPALTSH
jgi:nucleotide-binding universal stress UspA family protein